MLKVQATVRKLIESKKSYADLMKDIRAVVSEFKESDFTLTLDIDPEDSTKTLYLTVTSSDMPRNKLDKKLTSCLLPVYSKSVRIGLPVVHMIDLSISKKYA